MDKAYADTVRLLLRVAPDVFANDIFAMKGGTAINLFVHDMPRLSVDIDVVYTPRQAPREQALAAIGNELSAIAKRLDRAGLNVRKIASREPGDSKLIINSDDTQVKVEVNFNFRGTVLPIKRRQLTPTTVATFSTELDLPLLDVDELYGSKLVAAMDRQHPRDFFDVWQMFECSGLSDETIECFVTYLAGHNRPTNEVLFCNTKNIESDYHATFVGMTSELTGLETLLSVRARLLEELPKRLTDGQRRFLISLANAEPDWALLRCSHAAELPALRWKLANLRTFKQRRPDDFRRQAKDLESRLY